MLLPFWIRAVAEGVERLQPVWNVSSSKQRLCAGSFKTFSVHPAVNGYLIFFRAGVDKGGEEMMPHRRYAFASTSWLHNSHSPHGQWLQEQPLVTPSGLAGKLSGGMLDSQSHKPEFEPLLWQSRVLSVSASVLALEEHLVRRQHGHWKCMRKKNSSSSALKSPGQRLLTRN